MARTKRGRPPFIPTKEQRNFCRSLVATGHTQDEMATIFGVTRGTIRKAFKQELKDGRLRVFAHIKGRLVQKAMNGDNASMFFLLKTQDGWRETSNHQLLGKDGKPISFDSLAPDALDQVIAALRAALNAPGGGGVETEAEDQAGADEALDTAAGTTD